MAAATLDEHKRLLDEAGEGVAASHRANGRLGDEARHHKRSLDGAMQVSGSAGRWISGSVGRSVAGCLRARRKNSLACSSDHIRTDRRKGMTHAREENEKAKASPMLPTNQ